MNECKKRQAAAVVRAFISGQNERKNGIAVWAISNERMLEYSDQVLASARIDRNEGVSVLELNQPSGHDLKEKHALIHMLASEIEQRDDWRLARS